MTRCWQVFQFPALNLGYTYLTSDWFVGTSVSVLIGQSYFLFRFSLQYTVESEYEKEPSLDVLV